MKVVGAVLGSPSLISLTVSVEVLICLHSRKHLDINTATVVSAGAEGWIRAWSLNPKVGRISVGLESSRSRLSGVVGCGNGVLEMWHMCPFVRIGRRLFNYTRWPGGCLLLFLMLKLLLLFFSACMVLVCVCVCVWCVRACVRPCARA